MSNDDVNTPSRSSRRTGFDPGRLRGTGRWSDHSSMEDYLAQWTRSIEDRKVLGRGGS